MTMIVVVAEVGLMALRLRAGARTARRAYHGRHGA